MKLSFRIEPEEADALSSPQCLDIIMEHPHLPPAARSAVLSIALQHSNRAVEPDLAEALQALSFRRHLADLDRDVVRPVSYEADEEQPTH